MGTEHRPEVSPPPSLVATVRRVLTFSLAREHPWLEGELAGYEGEGDSVGQQLTRQMDYLFAACTLRRKGEICAATTNVSGAHDSEQTRIKNGVQLDFALGQLTPRKTSARGWPAGKIVCLATLTLLAYSLLNLTAGIVLLFRHDAMLTKMRPTLRNGTRSHHESVLIDLAGGARTCARREDIQYGEQFPGMAAFVQVNQELEQLGVATLTQVGATVFSAAFVLAAPLIFYCLPVAGVWRRSHRICLESLEFVYEPDAERARLARELRELQRQLAPTHDSEELQPARPDERTKWHALRAAAKWPGPAPEVAARAEFHELLDKIYARQLVGPIVMAREWRRDFVRTGQLILRAIFFCSACGLFSFFLAVFGADLYVRVLDRAAQSACARWHPNGTLLEPNLYLDPSHLFASLEEQMEYDKLAEGGSDGHHQFQLAKLIFLYESRHYLTRRALVFLLQLSLIIFFLALWSTLWTSLYLMTILDKIGWLVQIRAQLADCYRQVLGSVALDAARAREPLLARMTVAYVNYELFRRKYGPFMRLTALFVSQTIGLVIVGFLAAYLVASSIETKSQLLAAVFVGALLLFMNTYLLTSSLASKYIGSIVERLARLLAALAHHPDLAHTPIVGLWRRQLVSEHEVRLLASPHIFSLYISYKRIISFNAQLFAILLLVWRTFGPRAHEL